MISLSLARALRAAGLRWQPASGDRFVVPDRDMDDDVFVVSELTIEVHDLPFGKVLAFNGTTEWALDSVAAERVVWLPRETQLRELLGGTFRGLTRAEGAWLVRTERDGREHCAQHADAEEAYGLALLHLLDAVR